MTSEDALERMARRSQEEIDRAHGQDILDAATAATNAIQRLSLIHI